MKAQEFNFESHDYFSSLHLRNEILRLPLGLHILDEDLSSERESHHIGIFENQRCIACCVLKRVTDKEIRMRQLAVHTDYRGKGLSKTVIEYAEKLALQKGYKRIILHARQHVQKLYEKLGYSVEGDYFIEVGISHICMYKNLKNGH